jgi:hypothetical protein
VEDNRVRQDADNRQTGERQRAHISQFCAARTAQTKDAWRHMAG